jgi:hypothetical protein
MTKRVLAITFILAFLPFAANAASKNSANVVIDNNVTVGTTELPKGTYKVVWTGTDPNVQVTFTHGNWTTTVPAHIVEGRNNIEAEMTNVKDNKTFLTALELRNATLQFGDGTHAGEWGPFTPKRSTCRQSMAYQPIGEELSARSTFSDANKGAPRQPRRLRGHRHVRV